MDRRKEKSKLKFRRSGKVRTQVTTPDSEGELSSLVQTGMVSGTYVCVKEDMEGSFWKALSGPSSWNSHFCAIPFLWVWDGASYLLLINRLSQKWWDVNEMRLQKTMDFVPRSLSGFTPICSGRASCHVWASLWGDPPGRSFGSLQLTAWEKLNLVKNQVNEPEGHTLRWQQSCLIVVRERPWTRGAQLSCTWIPHP